MGEPAEPVPPRRGVYRGRLRSSKPRLLHFDLDVEFRANRHIALWGGDRTQFAASLGRIARAARRLIEDVRQLAPREGDPASWRDAPATSARTAESGTGHHPVTYLVRSVA